MASPKQVAARLRQIATKIENSKAPKRELVAEDLQEVLNVLENSEPAAEPPAPPAPPAAEPPPAAE